MQYANMFQVVRPEELKNNIISNLDNAKELYKKYGLPYASEYEA